MLVEDQLLLDVLQMEDPEDQVVVLLGIYQEQELLLQVELEMIHQLVLLKEMMDREVNITVQHTLSQEVEVVQEVQHQHLVQEVEVQQVMELLMEVLV